MTARAVIRNSSVGGIGAFARSLGAVAAAILVALASRVADGARVSAPTAAPHAAAAAPASVPSNTRFAFDCRTGPFGDEVVWTTEAGEELGYATPKKGGICPEIEKNKAAKELLWKNFVSDELFVAATYAFILRPHSLSFAFTGGKSDVVTFGVERRDGRSYIIMGGSSRAGVPFRDTRRFLLPVGAEEQVQARDLRRALVGGWRQLTGGPDAVASWFLGLDTEGNLRECGFASPTSTVNLHIHQFAHHIRQEFDGQASGEEFAKLLVGGVARSEVGSVEQIIDVGKILGYSAAMTKLVFSGSAGLRPEFIGFPVPNSGGVPFSNAK